MNIYFEESCVLLLNSIVYIGFMWYYIYLIRVKLWWRFVCWYVWLIWFFFGWLLMENMMLMVLSYVIEYWYIINVFLLEFDFNYVNILVLIICMMDFENKIYKCCILILECN